MGRTKGPQSSNSDGASDFAADYRNFLKDPENAALMRAVLLEPVLEEIEKLKNIISEKDAVIQNLEKKVSILEEQSDELEQYSRRNSLRVSGIPEDNDKDCYTHVLETLNHHLPSLPEPIALSEIDRLHRCGKPRADGRPRNVLIKFTSYQNRQKIMMKRSALKGTNIFLNEDLTQKRNNLLYSARVQKRNGHLRECWSSDGRILVKDLQGNTHLLKKTDDLKQFLPQPSK